MGHLSLDFNPTQKAQTPRLLSNAEAARKQDEDLRRFLEENAECSETEFEPTQEEKEEILDGCESPRHRASPYWTPAYQAKRDSRKLPPSPPSTPRHLKGRKTSRPREDIPIVQLDKVQKQGKRSRVAPRRPITRSKGDAVVSLHPHRKGKVVFWYTRQKYVTTGFKAYMRDYFSEELDKNPERPDFSQEDPKYPHKSDYQRELCRRSDAQDLALKDAVEVPRGYKGIF